MIEAVQADKSPSFEKLSLLEIGPEKGGKSWLAATARPPVLFIDRDLRSESLSTACKVSGLKDVYVLSVKESLWPLQPTAYGEVLDVILALEKSRDLGQWFPDAVGKIIKTVVVDSIQTHATAARAFVLYANSDKSFRRTINIGGKLEIHVPKSWEGWSSEMGMIENVIIRLLGIKDLDVIATLHQTQEEADDSTEESPKFTGRVGVYPARYKLLLKYFNEVWHVTRDYGKKPTITVVPDGNFTMAASNLDIDVIQEPNITKLIELALAKQGNHSK